jgi:hypothetical protein
MRPVTPLFKAMWLAVLSATIAGHVAAAEIPCPDPPIYPPTRAFVQPTRPCPGQDVRVLFATCAPCWDIVDVSQGPDGITVQTEQRPDSCIPEICLPESASVALGSFAAGHHAVLVRFVTTVVVHGDSADTAHCTFIHADTLEFDVAATCVQNTLPYVKELVIGRPSPCLSCPPQICAGESIPVLIRGQFPDDCIRLIGVELIPDASMGPLPQPPTLRIAYGVDDCIQRPCSATPVPWEARVELPPLPALAGHVYWLQVETVLRRFPCDLPPDTSVIGEAQFPFAVSPTCSTSAGACFLTSFVTAPVADSVSVFGRCDDFVGPGRPGYATFRIGSGVPLYGLEGEFVFDSRTLMVTGIETVGAAAGMRLAWQPTLDGARFVLYSEGGAHIPAATPMPSSQHLEILRIRVEQRSIEVAPPERIHLRASRLLGADAAGQGVNGCPIMFVIEPFDAYAVFCTEVTCDFNHDGSTDVRDLVRMVGCLNDSARCDLRRADCNGDGRFSLDDVFCCAHVLLGGGQPDTTGGRPDPSLRVRFGAPVEGAGTIEVPVTLDGANPVGGARLVLRYPSERFDVAAVEFPGRSSWLELHEVAGGRVVVAMLDLGSLPSTSFHHSFTLRLSLRAGQQPGGEVAVEAAEFSDPAGVALLADVGAQSVILGGGGVALGPGQPNPFGRDVRFGVTLARASDLEVSIHDLTGRLVATLHRGPAAEGGHTFQWDGRDASGSQAPDGIYFYRARAAGQILARKVILLREP